MTILKKLFSGILCASLLMASAPAKCSIKEDAQRNWKTFTVGLSLMGAGLIGNYYFSKKFNQEFSIKNRENTREIARKAIISSAICNNPKPNPFDENSIVQTGGTGYVENLAEYKKKKNIVNFISSIVFISGCGLIAFNLWNNFGPWRLL